MFSALVLTGALLSACVQDPGAKPVAPVPDLAPKLAAWLQAPSLVERDQIRSELVNLGWDEITLSHALVIVEWPERAGDLIPAGHVAIDLEYAPSDPERRVLLAG